MISEYLKYLYETEIDTGMGGVAKVNTKGMTFKGKSKGDKEEVEVGGGAEGLGIIKASVGIKKKIRELLMGDEAEVERRLDVASGVIVRRDDNNTQLVLLIQRAADDHWPNVWEFPRGKCDKPIGESILKCARREIKEETGLDITTGKLIDIYEYIADHGKRKSTCHVFECHMDDPNQEVKLSKEHQKYKWVSEAGVTELMLMPDQKRILTKVLNPERKIMNYPEGKGPKKIDESLDHIYEAVEIKSYKDLFEICDAIVYSAQKRDHKFIFLKDNAPPNITPDKFRKKGKPYIKNGRRVYDVVVDMYEMKDVKGGDGMPADIWMVANLKEAQHQLDKIMGAGAKQFHPKILVKKNNSRLFGRLSK